MGKGKLHLKFKLHQVVDHMAVSHQNTSLTTFAPHQ